MLTGEHLGALGKELLPHAVAQHIVVLLAQIDVDGIVAVGPVDVLLEREIEYAGTLAEPPFVGLVACQTGTVDAALLTGSDADGLAVFHVAHRIALCVFQCDEGYLQVAESLCRELLVLGGNVVEEMIVAEVDIIAVLLKPHAKDLLALNGLRYVVSINLNHVIGALALGLENLQCLGRIAWGDDTVTHLTLDEKGCGLVAGVAERTEVTIGAHTVGTAGPSIGIGQGSKLKVNVVDKVNLLQRVAQWKAHGSSGR